jgi:HSP20 family protein
MDRLFDEWWRGFGLEPFEGSWASFSPSVDVVETEDTITIQAELPGIEEKDFEVTLSGHMLTIKGEKREEKQERGQNTYWSERSFGSFQRVLSLPETANVDQANAEFKKGVLTITFPKAGETTNRIAIKTK